MRESDTVQEMTLDDRLKAIIYQFITLYERWSEDRQQAAKQGADMGELVKAFIEQVSRFESLEPKVREQLVTRIQQTTSMVTEKIGKEMGFAATQATQGVVTQLEQAVNQAQRTLATYQTETLHTQWKVIISTVLACIGSSLLIVAFLMPSPTFPLTPAQMEDLRSGQMMEKVWPQLSKKEQQHWRALASAIHPSD